MREAPVKTSAYMQGLLVTSASIKEKLGTLRIMEDGRKFRYAKNGAVALVAGKLTTAAIIVAAHIDATVAATNNNGTQVTLTVTAGTAIAEGALEGGFLQASEGLLAGRTFRIESNTAMAADGTSLTLSLADRLVGYDGTTKLTLVHNPWRGVVISATPEAFCTGAPSIAVPANHYFWAQTSGPACILCGGTPAVGTMVTMGAVDGSAAAINATLDIDQPIIGMVIATAGVDTKYKPIFLKID